jgi:hypothetical protein
LFELIYAMLHRDKESCHCLFCAFFFRAPLPASKLVWPGGNTEAPVDLKRPDPRSVDPSTRQPHCRNRYDPDNEIAKYHIAKC